jgi:phosphotransferase system enzyme I (PtsI)
MRVMLPLVSGVTELDDARTICDEVRASLTEKEARASAEAIPLGVMVETPSAALTVDHLARRCAFLSGTNDLIQYAFAADRDNDDVSYLLSAAPSGRAAPAQAHRRGGRRSGLDLR